MRLVLATILLVLLVPAVPRAQTVAVAAHSSIESDHGLRDTLDSGDEFGAALALIGDVDGDGVGDVAVGAPSDDGGPDDLTTGAVWVLFLRADGSIKGHQKIALGVGGLDDPPPGFGFGLGVAPLGDWDLDGVPDLVVVQANGGLFTPETAAVWILFLRTDGTVKSWHRLGDSPGGLAPMPPGASLGPVVVAGDVDADGVPDLAVGQFNGLGTIWILFMQPDAMVREVHKIVGGVDVTGLASGHGFGRSLAALGDVDGNGVPDLAVGTSGDNDGGTSLGSLRILFLQPDGSLLGSWKMDATTTLTGTVLAGDEFGASMTGLGDANLDGTPDLAVGAPGDDDGGSNRGSVHILHLFGDGHLASLTTISATAGGLAAGLDNNDAFGSGLASLGDGDGDGMPDLLVGAINDDDGGSNFGAAWSLSLDSDGHVLAQRKLSAAAPEFTSTLDQSSWFGCAVISPGDVDGDGVADLVAGSYRQSADRGAIWFLRLAPDGSVKQFQRIGQASGGFVGPLDAADQFGYSLASLGDLDGDGVVDVAVYAASDDDGGSAAGAIWILFLNADGTVKSEQKISATAGGFTGLVEAGDSFGIGMALLPDLDGDGVPELAAGASGDDEGGLNRGAVWILFLNADGTVKSQQKIASGLGGFGGTLANGDAFGAGLTLLDDLDGDGLQELAVGAWGTDAGADNNGAIWILYLESDGTVRTQLRLGSTGLPMPNTSGSASVGQRLATCPDLNGDGRRELLFSSPFALSGGPIDGVAWVGFLQADGSLSAVQAISSMSGGFTGPLQFADYFGSSICSPGDIDGDGRPELAVGATRDDHGGLDHGAIWLLHLASAPWQWLGSGLAGTHGIPLLKGSGDLQASSPMSIELTGARENSIAMLFAATSSSPVSFKGGVLLPFPPNLVLGAVTDGAGEILLASTWPAGVPSGVSAWFQQAIADPAAPKGVALSNALKLTTP